MNYQLIYDQLILKAKQRPHEVEGEIHHIIPKWMWVVTGKRGELEGDPDAPENLVKLTYREHLVAHRLLARTSSLKFRSSAYGAVMFMLSTVEKKDRNSSRKYAAARREAIIKLRRDDVNEDSILQMMIDNFKEIKLIDNQYLTVSEINRLCSEKLFFATGASRIKDIHQFILKLSAITKTDIKFDPFYRSEAQRLHAKSIMSNKIWVTMLESKKYISIDENDFDENTMVRGRLNLKTTKGMVHISKDNVQKAIPHTRIDEFIRQGWKLGGLSKKAATKDYIKVIIDGKRDFVPFDVAAEMWKQGRCTSNPQRVVAFRGNEVVVFNSILEMKLCGFKPVPKTARAKRVVIHKQDDEIMVPVEALPSLLEQGWSIGRRGAKKKQALKRTDVMEILNENQN